MMEIPTTNNLLVWGLFRLAPCDKCFQYVLGYSMRWGLVSRLPSIFGLQLPFTTIHKSEEWWKMGRPGNTYRVNYSW